MIRKLLTKEGYEKLKDELKYLTRERRPEVTEIRADASVFIL